MWRGVVLRERFDVELRVQRDVDTAVCWHCGRVVIGRVVVRNESGWGKVRRRYLLAHLHPGD